MARIHCLGVRAVRKNSLTAGRSRPPNHGVATLTPLSRINYRPIKSVTGTKSSKRSATRVSDPIGSELAAVFRALIPKNEDIVRQALSDVLAAYGGDVAQMKAEVSKIVTDAEARAYQIYKEAQWPAQTKAIRGVFGQRVRADATAAAALDLVAQNAKALDQFYLSVSQGRKARAGTAVETFFDTLFRAMGYPFERKRVINGTPDFVFPSVAHFNKLSTDCVIFTSKRTLRERWRQITSEGSRGFVLFLGTLDATVKRNDLEAMRTQKINVVVPEHIRLAIYPHDAHVISVEVFLGDYLDPAMDRWRRRGVIT